MALFELPERTNSKSNDMKIAKQSKVNKTAPTVIRGGSSLLDRISQIKDLVERHLGKYKENSILIQDEIVLSNYIDKCIENGAISIDTETTGLDPLLDDIAGICIYTPNEKGAYIPINHVSYITNERVSNQLAVELVRKHFNRLIDSKIDIIMFNAVFDIRVLRNKVGLHNIYCTWDCYIAQRLLNENEDANSLKPLHRKYVLNGQEDAFRFDDLFNGVQFTLIPLKTAYLYACHDPVITYELYEYQKKYLCSEREDMKALYWSFTHIEMPVLDAVANMEDNGVCLDLDYQQKLSVKYHKLLTEKVDAFYDNLKPFEDKILKYRQKHSFNCKLDNPIKIGSAPQLAILLYDILEYKPADKKKPRGTGEEILTKYDTPLAKAILEWRGVEKLINTYIDKLPNCLNPNDNRIHGKFNSYGAVTGRFSSKDPNLQNIPSHCKDIRPMFKATDEIVEVIESDNSFVVDRWSEVNTVDGWKYADNIIVGDKLSVVDNNSQVDIIVSRIEVLVDSNQIVYYY